MTSLLQHLRSPILLSGGPRLAFRDPAVVFHDGIFHLFHTLVRTFEFGEPRLQVAVSRSSNLSDWSKPTALTTADPALNFSSPGSIVRDGDRWVMCLQTYPRPRGEKYGNARARLYTMTSRDLHTWNEPELLRVKGPCVAEEAMGRMIDPYIFGDKDRPGRWWCSYKQGGVSLATSADLLHWTPFGRVDGGENSCVIVDGDEYLLFHSPANGIGLKSSRDLIAWRDRGLLTLGQREWPWARGRLTAGFALDLRNDPRMGRILLFFHGSGPEDERTMFDEYASIGLAWSDGLGPWEWAGMKKARARSEGEPKG